MTTVPINEARLLEAFKDDTRIAALTMPYLLKELGYTLVREKSGWLCAWEGAHYKVRALTQDGVSFGPSVAKGAGRTATAGNWEKGVEAIAGFIVFDAVDYSAGVKHWIVLLATVEGMRSRGIVGIDGSCNRRELMKQL